MNYVELTNAVWNTLLVCCGCMAIAVPSGTALAILLLRTDVAGRRMLAIALGSQLALPLYVFAGSWNAGFGFQGWWPLSQVFALEVRKRRVHRSHIHPLNRIDFLGRHDHTGCGLVWSQRSLEESAIAEQGNRAVCYRAFCCRGLRPWLALSCLWVCVPILTEMVVTNLYQVPTVAEQVYLDASRGAVSPLTYPVAVAIVHATDSRLEQLRWGDGCHRGQRSLHEHASIVQHSIAAW